MQRITTDASNHFPTLYVICGAKMVLVQLKTGLVDSARRFSSLGIQEPRTLKHTSELVCGWHSGETAIILVHPQQVRLVEKEPLSEKHCIMCGRLLGWRDRHPRIIHRKYLEQPPKVMNVNVDV